MADPHDQPDSEPNGATPPEQTPPEQPPAEPTPPEQKPAAKAAKKTPAKKAPVKKAAAKKTPAKKAPAKQAPDKSPAPAKPAVPPANLQDLIETNGELAAAAKDVAAQAKSTIDDANNPVAPVVVASSPSQSAVPLAIAVALSLLAILLIRQLRRR